MPKTYDICVVGGAGRVGLPLSIAFADNGKSVVVFDINRERLSEIENKRMPFYEEGAENVLKKVVGDTLFISSDPHVVSEANFVIVVIGTPVDEHLNPKYDELKRFFEDISHYLRDDQIIIMRSTVYPGLTEKTRRQLKKKNSSLEICFCPERIAEGKAMTELYSLPQIVSGFAPDAIEKVSELFNLLTDDIVVIDPLEAELAKLFTNSWRYIQFAAANQFYMIAQEYGLDFYRVFDAMTSNYPRLKGFPKPGWAAGPCLFKDTMQISAFANNKFFLGHSAMLINEGLPNFIIEQLKAEMELQDKVVGVLGMAFKGESDDKRESLSYKLRKILLIEAKDVLCSDPYIKDEAFVSTDKLIEKCDIVIIGAPHQEYHNLDFKNTRVVDVWNMLGKYGIISK